MLANRRILVLESDPAHEVLVVQALRALGAGPIEVARDALEALDHLVREPPELRAEVLVLEVGPAVGAGLEVLTAIRDDPVTAPLPAIVLSTSGEQERLVAACFGTTFPCVRKPIDIIRLRAALERAGGAILEHEAPSAPFLRV
jgi:two-component system response regulator